MKICYNGHAVDCVVKRILSLPSEKKMESDGT